MFPKIIHFFFFFGRFFFGGVVSVCGGRQFSSCEGVGRQFFLSQFLLLSSPPTLECFFFSQKKNAETWWAGSAHVVYGCL